MSLVASRYIPTWLIRIRNWFVDQRIRFFSPVPPQPSFRDGHTHEGLLIIPEKHGPVLPPVIEDIEAALRAVRDEILLDDLLKRFNVISGHRGFVHEPDPQYRSVEFFFPQGSVFVRFNESTGTVRLKTPRWSGMHTGVYEALVGVLFVIEDVLYGKVQLAAE